jgi:hypothetical protein
MLSWFDKYVKKSDSISKSILLNKHQAITMTKNYSIVKYKLIVILG